MSGVLFRTLLQCFLLLLENCFQSPAFLCFRRLNTLNKCASMKLDVNLQKKKVSVEARLWSFSSKCCLCSLFFFILRWIIVWIRQHCDKVKVHYIYLRKKYYQNPKYIYCFFSVPRLFWNIRLCRFLSCCFSFTLQKALFLDLSFTVFIWNL